jgi:hypothetical protein
MKFRSILAAATVAVAFSATVPAQAVVLFNSDLGTSSIDGGITGNNPEAQGYYVAQDFSLGSNSTLNSFFYNAYTAPDTVPVTAVNLNIYSDVGNAPGSQLYSGTFSVASQVVTGTASGYTLQDYGVNLPSWALNAGSYFVALNVLPIQWDMHWTVPSSPTLPGNSYISATGAPGTFSSYPWDHTFRFEGAAATATPLPSTWLMLLSGFVGLGFFAYRGTKKNAVATA